MSKGIFIAIEGIDGAGVTTQAERLQEKLETYLRREVDSVSASSGPLTHLTKEPTDGPAGGQIRLALSERLELDPQALALFFATDRKDHVETVIKPLLEDGYIVIADRYYLSSYAFQLDAVDGDLEWLRQINSKAITPDLTVLLDVDAATSRKRREQDRLTEELFENEETLQTVRENYVEIADRLGAEGEPIEIVDGAGDQTAVFDRVWERVSHLLSERAYLDTVGES